MKNKILIYLPLILIAFTTAIGNDIQFKTTTPIKKGTRPAFKREYWPTSDWKEKKPDQAGISAEKLSEIEKYAFTLTGDDKNRKGIRTDGLIIVKDGYIIFEKYGRGNTKEKPHLVWSVTKSFVNALYGIAVKHSLLSLTDSVDQYIPGNNKKEIALENFLQMSSGIDWNEGYEASPLKSSVIAMLYTAGKGDMGLFTLQRPMTHKPGTFLYYSSGDSNVLMSVLKTVLGKEHNNWPWDKLFLKIGMKKTIWEKDQSGTFVGSSYIYAPPREIAKFGYLYLNNGKWDREQIFPEGWVDFTTTTAPSFFTTPATPDLKNHLMGAHWYMNYGDATRSVPKSWPDAPEDTFAASGHWGQKIWVIPSLDMVIVRTADDRDHSFDENHFLKLATESVRKK